MSKWSQCRSLRANGSLQRQNHCGISPLPGANGVPKRLARLGLPGNSLHMSKQPPLESLRAWQTLRLCIFYSALCRRQELGVCLLTHYAKFPKCSRGSAWLWDARLALFTFCKSCSDRPQDAGKGWGQLIRMPIHIGSEDAVDVDRIFLPLLKEVENKLKESYFKWKYPYQLRENHENNFLPYYDVICGTYVGQSFKTKGDPHATHQQLAVCHYVSYTVLEMER